MRIELNVKLELHNRVKIQLTRCGATYLNDFCFVDNMIALTEEHESPYYYKKTDWKEGDIIEDTLRNIIKTFSDHICDNPAPPFKIIMTIPLMQDEKELEREFERGQTKPPLNTGKEITREERDRLVEKDMRLKERVNQLSLQELRAKESSKENNKE